jgi:hypothetical protein
MASLLARRLCAALMTLLLTAAGAHAATPSAPLFSPTSVWNASAPSGAPLAADSAGVVAHLNAFVQSDEQQKRGPWINTTAYSTPLYVVGAAQSTVPIIVNRGGALGTASAAVPLPAGAQPSAGSDAQLTVYQPSSNTLWEYWGMSHLLFPPWWLSAAGWTGGSLQSGTYYYAVTALTPTGETTISPLAHYQAPAQGVVQLWWAASVGARAYNIYRGTDPGHLSLVGTLVHQTTGYNDPADTWTDTGSASPSPVAPPTSNTATSPGQWQAAYGGRMRNVSRSPGYYRNILGTTGNVLESNLWGATASSLPLSAGLITLADLAAGHINHALELEVPEADALVAWCPAQRTDGYDTSSDAIPDGAHLRLDPALNLSTISMSPITRMIARAAQRYGMIVNDQTGWNVTFRAEDPTPLIQAGQANPYTTYFGGQSPSQFLTAFPWSHLQLLAPPATCS